MKDKEKNSSTANTVAADQSSSPSSQAKVATLGDNHRGPLNNREKPIFFRKSTSPEGWTPPQVRFRLAQGSRGFAAPAPSPPAGALNVLTQCRRPSQRRIHAMPSL
jgi:hypothetical protein